MQLRAVLAKSSRLVATSKSIQAESRAHTVAQMVRGSLILDLVAPKSVMPSVVMVRFVKRVYVATPALRPTVKKAIGLETDSVTMEVPEQSIPSAHWARTALTAVLVDGAYMQRPSHASMKSLL
jgi:hypothetical protein